MAAQQQASAANRRLAQQLANRPGLAMGDFNQMQQPMGMSMPMNNQMMPPPPQRSLKQRLGKANVKARLNLDAVGRGGMQPRGRGAFPRGAPRFPRGRGQGGNIQMRGRGGGGMRGGVNASPRGGPFASPALESTRLFVTGNSDLLGVGAAGEPVEECEVRVKVCVEEEACAGEVEAVVVAEVEETPCPENSLIIS
nr:hypothetical protein BaRGS_000076 [Batillaria attramentaria]